VASKRKLWFGLVLAAAIFNIGFGVYTSLGAEPMHAFFHGALAAALGIWAWHLRPQSTPPQPPAARVELLEQDVSDLQRKSAAQELIDFDKQLRGKR
jgi:hypothetical protein